MTMNKVRVSDQSGSSRSVNALVGVLASVLWCFLYGRRLEAVEIVVAQIVEEPCGHALHSCEEERAAASEAEVRKLRRRHGGLKAAGSKTERCRNQ